MKTIYCSFCGDRIIQDRYNISYVLERQDHPPSGDWQKSIDFYKEDVCPKCQEIITRYCYNFMEEFRKNKGNIKLTTSI